MENSAHKETHDSVVEEDLELNKLEDDLALIENAMEKIDQEDLKGYETVEAEITGRSAST
ncbi:MAG: hypothetical protein CL452_00835 [Acidimicrobiaceae bacterium]|nr:hypothetical protein [Acidimicrobiaceae bacterium]MBD26284.1 hypothetical protein [Acidimicrobiaceae bacterium]CAI8404224.1 MAG: Uncharacterised protein [Acidimicrobiaceae bacterium]|tara:strand:+ start:3233 stop:3412 length:180 start_codon:yes stop_codon:yes gene_type:complete